MAPKRVMKATRRDDEDDEMIDVGGDGAVVAPTVAPTRTTNMMRVVQDRRRRTEGAGDRSAMVNEAAEADIAASRAARRAGGHAAGAGAAVNEDGAGADEDWEDATDTDDGDYDHEDDDELSEEIIDDGDDEDSDAEGDDEDAAYAELQGEAGAMAGAAAGAAAGATKKVGFTEPEEEEGPARVWRRDQGEKLADGQGLAYSNKAYDSFFQLRTEFPCLTFQVLRDFDGEMRTKYPLTMYLACGTQAPTAAENQLVLLKISNISRTRFDEESESDDDMIGMEDGVEDDDDDEDDVEEVNDGEAIVEYRTVAHHGAVNRLRTNPAAPNIIATWSDAGHVNVFDVQAEARQLADFANWSREQAQAWRTAAKPSDALKFTSSTSAHACEGYGLGWSRVDTTRFASGDCSGRLVVWTPADGGRYTVLAAHGEAGRQGSVEEIVWSPTEASVFVAARAGGIVEVFDTRDLRRSMLRWRADPTDINVADWNPAKTSSHLLATGADSGAVAIWDLRTVGAAGTSGQALTPLQTLMFHEGSRVTSVEFSAHNESVLSVTSDDGQCTLWDLSLERDEDEERQMVGDLFGRADVGQLPDQLMFQHQGLQHPKEAHFHPQIPGMSITCDYNGLHLFKPMNWRSLMK